MAPSKLFDTQVAAGSAGSARRRSCISPTDAEGASSPRATGSPTGRAVPCRPTAPLRRGRRRVSARRSPTSRRDMLRRRRPARMGRRRVRGAAPARPQAARPAHRVVAHQGRPAAAGEVAWRGARGCAHGANDAPRSRTCRRVTSSPISRSPASSPGHRIRDELPAVRGIDGRACVAPGPRSCSARSARASSSIPREIVMPARDHTDGSLAPALSVICGVDRPARARDAPRTGAARHTGRPRRTAQQR